MLRDLYSTPDVMRGKKFINVISGMNEQRPFLCFRRRRVSVAAGVIE